MSLTIQLDKSIRVSHNGELKEVELLTVALPNVAGFNLYADIKTIVTNSMFELEKKVKANATSDNNSSEELESFPLDLFLASNTIIELSKAINKYLINFAKWDNEIKVTEAQIRKLSIKDYNKILERVSYFLYRI